MIESNIVDIDGKWNKEDAKKIVLSQINKNFDSIQNNYSHQILNFYNIDDLNKQTIIAMAFSRPKRIFDKDGMNIVHSCHACGGELSFIEFRKYSNGWKVENKFFRILENGQWGEPSSDWKLINLGFHKYGFIMEGGGTGQGYTEIYTRIYSIIGDEFKEIFNMMTVFDDSGAKIVSEDSYDSKLDFIKEGTGYYDLIVSTKGIKNKKKFSEKKYFKFDGIKYSLSENIK